MDMLGRQSYQGLLDWEVSWPFLKGMDIMSSRELLEQFLHLSERIVDRDVCILYGSSEIHHFSECLPQTVLR